MRCTKTFRTLTQPFFFNYIERNNKNKKRQGAFSFGG